LLGSSLSVLEAQVSFKFLEMQALEKARRAALADLKRTLEELDARLWGQRGPELVLVDIRSRKVLTAVGEVEIRRRYCRRPDGSMVFPLDEAIGLEPKKRLSPQLKKLAVSLSCELTYRRAVDVIEEVLGVRFEAQSAHAIVQEIGGHLEESEEQLVAAVLDGQIDPEPGEIESKFLITEADGVTIRLQREGRQKSAEIKVSITHDGWEREYGDRYRLKHKFCYAVLGDAETLWDRAGLGIHARWDLSTVVRTVVGGDGAEWVKQGLSYLPSAEFQLDEYHARRRITEAMGNTRLARAVGDGVVEGRWEQALEIVGMVREHQPDRKQELDALSGWIYQNRDELKDYRLREGYVPEDARGTGAIESNVDKYVANRFKKRGRGWTIRGAQNLLHVINQRENGRLEGGRGEMARDKSLGGLFDGVEPKRQWPAAGVPLLGIGNNNEPYTRLMRRIQGGGIPTY